MRFWTFNQNNSGGSFDFDEKRGITHHVIIEAMDRDDAIRRAENIGLYFDGCERGIDCPCCGDRWHEPYSDAGDEQPEVYGTKVRETGSTESLGGWMPEGRETCVHPVNGPVEWYPS